MTVKWRIYVKRAACLAGAISLCLISLACLAYFAWLRPMYDRDYLFNYNDQVYPSLARSFSLALMKNDAATLETAVVQDRLSDVANWLDEHEYIKCRFPYFDGDLFLTYEPYGYDPSSRDRQSLTVTIDLPCPNDRNRYRLKVKDMVLLYREGHWKVFDWQTCEEWYSFVDGSQC